MSSDGPRAVSRLTVLLVDDEPGIVNALSLLLNALGHKVIGYTDPLLALEYLKKEPDTVDLVLSDLRMPVITGRELLMLSLSSAPNLPVVLMSAHADDEQISQLMAEGAFEFLAKPFNVDQFRRLAERITDFKLQKAS